MPNNQNNIFPQPVTPQSKSNGFTPIIGNQSTSDVSDLGVDNLSVPPVFINQNNQYNQQYNQQYNSQQNQNQQPNPTQFQNFRPINNQVNPTTNLVNNLSNTNQNNSYQVNSQPINSDFNINGTFDQNNENQEVSVETLVEKINPTQKILDFIKKNILYVGIAGGIVLLIIISLVAVAIFGNNDLQSTDSLPFSNVMATISGPKSLPQGTPGKWEIRLRNNETAPILDLQLDMVYDQDFQLTNFLNYKPDVGNNLFKINRLDGVGIGSQETIISIEGFLNAQVDIETLMQGKLTYTPSVIATTKNNRRQVEVVGLRTRVTSPEIQLSIAPSTPVVQNGGEAEFVIKIKNIKENDLQDLRLKIDYPAGNIFNYVSSQFTASNTSQKITSPSDGDNIWYISRLAGLSEQTLILKGVVNVKSEQKVALGVVLSKKSNTNEYKDLKNAIKDVTVSSLPIILSTSIEKENKTFTPGEVLTFNIDYFNQSQDVIKNAEILGFVDDQSKLLDLKTVAFTGGNRAYINNSQIQWVGNNTPELVSIAPQARGRLTYSITVKPTVLVNKKPQGEYNIRPQVKIRALNLQDIAVSGDLYKMTSNLRFTQLDTQEVPIVSNTQSNRKRYRVQWSIQSEQNQIDSLNIIAVTTLPPDAYQPKSLVKPENSTFEYNPTNGTIIFAMNKIIPYTGLAKDKPPLLVSFDFETEDPSLTSLVGVPTITAIDNFTGEQFNFAGKETTTNGQ